MAKIAHGEPSSEQLATPGTRSISEETRRFYSPPSAALEHDAGVMGEIAAEVLAVVGQRMAFRGAKIVPQWTIELPWLHLFVSTVASTSGFPA